MLVPLLPANSLITVTGCGPTHWLGSGGGRQGLRCRPPGQARSPSSACPPLSPWLSGGCGDRWCQITPTEGSWGPPGPAALERRQGLPAGLCLEPPVQERPRFQSASRGLSLKHQNRTTFDGVGKSAVGRPVQECAWEKGSTHSFTVLKMYERTQQPPYLTWMQTPHRHESKTPVLLHTPHSFWVPHEKYRVLCTPAHTEMRGIQITHSS